MLARLQKAIVFGLLLIVAVWVWYARALPIAIMMAGTLLLMFGHAVWASAVLLRRDEHALRTFHRISITVWSIWLIPFISGMLLGRSRRL